GRARMAHRCGPHRIGDADDRVVDSRLRAWSRTMSAPDMTPKSPTMRTPLGKVRSLGSARSGTSDFFRQRITAVAMILLIIPSIVIIMKLLGSNQATASQILGNPAVAVIMILFI